MPPHAPLLEREGAVEQLRSALARSREGGEVVLVEGPAGIGKSRLIEVLRGRADGFEVLWARGGALEDIAFGVVRQLLERRVSLAPEEEREALLGGGAAAAAPVLGIATSRGGPSAGDLAGALHGLFWAVANLAEQRPLLIVLTFKLKPLGGGRAADVSIAFFLSIE